MNQVIEPSAQHESMQYLTFMLAGEEYGIDNLRVQGIQGWDKVTQIPNSPAYVLGVSNLRGSVVPIFDLRRCFALEPAQFAPTTVVVVLRMRVAGQDRTVGLVVDAVSDVHSVTPADRRPAPDLGAASSTAFVAGLASLGDEMMILLDIDALLDDVGDVAKRVAA
jgi:purine-binding chemotaxis protein CheW